jgi:hypothetical protein
VLGSASADAKRAYTHLWSSGADFRPALADVRSISDPAIDSPVGHSYRDSRAPFSGAGARWSAGLRAL